MNTQIAITGMGVISPIGDSIETFWEQLCAGKTGIKPYCQQHEPILYAALLENFSPEKYLGRKGFRYYSTSTRYLLSSILAALGSAPLSVTPTELGIVTGTTLSSVEDWARLAEKIYAGGYTEISPMETYNFSMNMPSSISSIRTNAKALNITLCSGMGAGVDAIMYAVDCLRLRRAKVIVAAGVEEVKTFTLTCFKYSNYLAKYKNGQNQPAAPFDKARTGASLGEGSAALVLETLPHAVERRAKIFAILIGYSSGFIPHTGINHQKEVGALVDVMTSAIQMAGLVPAQIDAVVSSGSGSVWADRIEADAICKVLGNRKSGGIPVTSIKGATGEALAVSGILQHTVAALTANRGKLPPTIGSLPIDPIGKLKVPQKTLEREMRYILVTLCCDDGFLYSSVVARQ